MEQVIELYKKLLKVCHSVADEQGLISVELIDDTAIKSRPVTIEGKRLALPTFENMKSNANNELVLFHPLNESIIKDKESPVLSRFRKNIKFILNTSIGIIMESLINLGASVAEHKKLSPLQGEILSIMKNVNSNTLKTFTDIITKGEKEIEFINFYIRKNGNVKGKIYHRICVVSFPFYEELKDADKRFNGIKITNKEKEIFLTLFKFIFTLVDEDDSYNKGHLNETAPSIDCLMQSVKVIAKDINRTIRMYHDFIKYADKILVNEDWIEDMEKIDTFKHLIKSIPMQAGNAVNNVQPTSSIQQPNRNFNQPQQFNNQGLPNYDNMSREQRILAQYGRGQSVHNPHTQVQQHGSLNAVPSWKKNQNQQYYNQPNNNYYPQQQTNNQYPQQSVNNGYNNQGNNGNNFGYTNNYNL